MLQCSADCAGPASSRASEAVFARGQKVKVHLSSGTGEQEARNGSVAKHAELKGAAFAIQVMCWCVSLHIRNTMHAHRIAESTAALHDVRGQSHHRLEYARSAPLMCVIAAEHLAALFLCLPVSTARSCANCARFLNPHELVWPHWHVAHRMHSGVNLAHCDMQYHQ